MTHTLVLGSAKRALLDRLIDDASLFPPATLAMDAALRAHVRHEESAYAWIGGRFVVPAARLDELVAQRPAGAAFDLSVILDAEADALPALAPLAALDAHDDLRIGALELHAAPDAHAIGERVATIGQRRSAIRALAGDAPLSVAIEIPYDAGWAVAPAVWMPHLAAARADGVRVLAKLRCGGAAAGATPSVPDLAAALIAAHDAGVAVKATAGLHHPVRGTPSGGTIMHGFLNVAFAALALHAGAADAARVAEILEETDPRAFAVDPRHVAWRDVALDAAAIVAGRDAAFAGFGSCSFDEPVMDLHRLGILA